MTEHEAESPDDPSKIESPHAALVLEWMQLRCSLRYAAGQCLALVELLNKSGATMEAAEALQKTASDAEEMAEQLVRAGCAYLASIQAMTKRETN